MAFSTQHSKETSPQINITPLIDVLLVLLIIFMIIGPGKSHKFEAKIPDKPSETAQPEPVTPMLLVVSLDQTSSLKLNNHSISAEELSVTLRKIFAERTAIQRTLFIKAPRELHYGAITNVIDLVKSAGAAPIGLQIDYLEL